MSNKQVVFYPPEGGDPVHVSPARAEYYESIGWKRSNKAEKLAGKKTPAPEKQVGDGPTE